MKPSLPIVVQVGFAGSRELASGALEPSATAAFEDALVEKIVERLQALRGELGLTTHFYCGISQMAIGADTLFTRACARSGILQRVFLPQRRTDFLAASGELGSDFSSAQRDRAAALLDSPHVVEERVVSDAEHRHVQFEDVNIEIVDESDVLLCLVRDGAELKPGGTMHAIEVAIARKVPVLEIRVATAGTAPVLTETWHGKEHFVIPTAPDAIAFAGTSCSSGSLARPDPRTYVEELHRHSSAVAGARQTFFANAAMWVIGAHVVATILAAAALAAHGFPGIGALLAFEIICLLTGFGVHQYLHRAHASRVWAVARCTAEITRSTSRLGKVRADLSFLLDLPYPNVLRPLLRTLHVLQLSESRSSVPADWESERRAYVNDRALDQLDYYRTFGRGSETEVRFASWTFTVATLLACAATISKLLMAGRPDSPEVVTKVLGTLAIALPVVAVGALSLVAALDREARAHTFREMAHLLEGQVLRLEQARSEREFVRLAIRTEAYLLGENANWLSRRAYTGVA